MKLIPGIMTVVLLGSGLCLPAQAQERDNLAGNTGRGAIFRDAGGQNHEEPGMTGAETVGRRGNPLETMLMALLRNEELAAEVGLTEDQIRSLKDSMYSLRREQIKLKSEQELAGLDQIELLSGDNVDEEAVMAAVDRKYEIVTQLAKLQVKQILLIKKTLTEDQLKKIRNLIRERAHERVGGNDGNRREELRRAWQRRRQQQQEAGEERQP